MPRKRIIDIDVMRGPIMGVWNEVCYDLQTSCSENNQRLTNTIAIECCIDADRLTTHNRGGIYSNDAKAAEAELDRAIKEHGYTKVFNALCRGIRLV